jgi:hypothetical protein
MQSTLDPQTLSLVFRASDPTAATEAATIRRLPPEGRARRLSGRPSCRIYLRRSAWILEFDTICGGWMEPSDRRPVEPKTLAFPTLAAAVGYAERHGYDYRIEPPARRSGRSVKRLSREQRLPRSWLALLSNNARNGRLYHA